MTYKAAETDSVEIISAERADLIGFNCMTPRPAFMNEISLLSVPFQRPGINHELFMGHDAVGQFYLKCTTLTRDQWSARFGNGV